MAKMKLFCVLAAAMFLIPPMSMMQDGETAVSDIDTIVENIAFSQPIIKEKGQYISVNVEGANSCLRKAGKPILPVYSKTFEFPFGTKIVDVKCLPSGIQQKILSKEIIPAPEPIPQVSLKRLATKGEEICNSPIVEIFPRNWYDYRIGCGLDGNDRMVFLTIRFYPIRYYPLENLIQYASNIEIRIVYQETSKPIVFNDGYDLVIIAPSKFSDELKPLVDHKNSYGISTKLFTLKEIYENYDGRDKQEKIKYFIKDAYDNLGIKYVMLVGDFRKVPVRYSHLETDHEYPEPKFISDLYYADIYDANGSFSSWDSDNDGIFGEWPLIGNRDIVDLYPDVYVGRLACRNVIEVKNLVNKIINYEENAHGQEWFNNMIVVGGDTFNESAYSADTDYLEGEVATEKALEYMGEFNPIKIWASKGNLNERNIRRAINEGAGFLYFCGHGNPATWATHPHGDFDTWIGYYRNWNIFFLRNNGKFPILMVGGCHNSQFNVTPLNLLKNPIDAIYKSNWVLECWSWRFVSKIGGGAIASIGSTGYGGVEIGDFNQNGVPDCIEGADGWFETHFFKLYAQEKNILGELWGQTVTDYISNFPVMDNRYDCKIVECHTLLGDPSLKIGGYPS